MAPPRCLVLYGTTDGQAKAIAEDIFQRFPLACPNIETEIFCLDQSDKKFDLTKERCVVIVCATTGDGDPPENAQRLVRRLKSGKQPVNCLQNLSISFLGLGDTNYSTFCGGGKQLEKRLRDLGACVLYPSGWADDAVGLEIVVDPWIEGLFPALNAFYYDCPDVEEPIISHDGTDSGVDSDVTNSLVSSIERLKVSHGTDQYHLSPGVNAASDDIITSSSSSMLDGVINQLSHITLESTEGELLGDSSLHEVELTVPASPPDFLKLDFVELDISSVQNDGDSLINLMEMPCSAGPLVKAALVQLECVTSKDALKTAYRAEFEVNSSTSTLSSCQAGDSVGILCTTPPDELYSLLERLKVNRHQANQCSIKLSVLPDTKKRRAAVPDHLQTSNDSPDGDTAPPLTLVRIFSERLDIRQPPNKALLRCLADHCSRSSEKRRMLELCSRQGQALYTKYIREPALTLLDVLHWFPSCQPPVVSLLELLPRLLPRPYSLASLPNSSSPAEVSRFSVFFNLVTIPQDKPRLYAKCGLATGALERLWQEFDKNISSEDEETERNDTSCVEQPIVYLYPRKNLSGFRPTSDISKPMILIGPGTGCAPFVSFLQHRQQMKQSMMNDVFGDIWLFHGCRNQGKDDFFVPIVSEFLSTGVLTHFCICYSRDSSTEVPSQCCSQARYVQHHIRHHSDAISDLVVNQGASVFVCGDARGMARDVADTFVDVLMASHPEWTREKATEVLVDMRIQKRYLEDVWT